MTEDHAATLGGQDSSFNLQLKWISQDSLFGKIPSNIQ